MVCIIASSAGGVKNNLAHFAAHVARIQLLSLARVNAVQVAAGAAEATDSVALAESFLSRLHGVHSITG